MNIDFSKLNDEELAACIDVVNKMREKRRKAEETEAAKSYIRWTISSTIDVIGIEETKRIIREINRDLRGQ